MDDYISRQAAIEALLKDPVGESIAEWCFAESAKITNRENRPSKSDGVMRGAALLLKTHFAVLLKG